MGERFEPKTGLIVGVGPGLSAALARRFAAAGVRLLLAARDIGKLEKLCAETGAEAVSCDATDPEMVAALFCTVDDHLGPLDLCVYNAGLRLRGAIGELDPAAVERALRVNAFGGFLVAQQAVRRMLPRGQGCLLFIGATASLEGRAHSAPFAMGKFALRALAQALARELHPQGIHVIHLVIDGRIRRPGEGPGEPPDSTLDPADIAEAAWHLATQPRSAWSDEIVLRPWVEPF